MTTTIKKEKPSRVKDRQKRERDEAIRSKEPKPESKSKPKNKEICEQERVVYLYRNESNTELVAIGRVGKNTYAVRYSKSDNKRFQLEALWKHVEKQGIAMVKRSMKAHLAGIADEDMNKLGIKDIQELGLHGPYDEFGDEEKIVSDAIIKKI